MKSICIKLIPFLIILAVTCIILFPSLLLRRGEILYGGDVLLQFYYWKGYLVESVRNGIVPFWNPYLFAGTPFLAHPGVSFFYPLTVLFFLFPLPASFSWVYVVHLVIAGAGAYYFSRIYTSRLTSSISSFIFISSGYFAARIYAGHVDLFTTAVWIPWVFAFFIRKKIIPTVISLCLLILAGYNAYFIFTVEFLGIYSLAEFIKNEKTRIINFRYLIVSILLSLLISAVAWIPTYELANNSIRGSGLPYEVASWGSLPLSGIQLFLNPLNRVELNKISFNLGGGPRENPFDHFIGVTSIVVFILGILIHLVIRSAFFRKIIPKPHPLPSDFWIFIVVILFSLWVSFGIFAPINLHGFLYSIFPMYTMMRIPLQHLILPVVLVPIIIGILINKLPALIRIIIGSLILCELVIWGRPYIFNASVPDVTQDFALIANLKKNEMETRILPHYRVISPVLASMDLNAYEKHHLFSTSGYDPIILNRYFRFLEYTSGYSSDTVLNYNVEVPPIVLREDLLDFLGVNKIVSEKGENVSEKLKKFTIESESQIYNLYSSNNKSAFYFLTDKIIPVTDSQEASDLLKNPAIDLSNTIIFNSEDNKNNAPFFSPCSSAGENKIILSNITNNSYIFNTEIHCPQFLATSIPSYPGWRVYIDKNESQDAIINEAFQGTYIPSGSHTVVFKYVPVIYFISFGITLIGLIIFLGMYRLNYFAKINENENT